MMAFNIAFLFLALSVELSIMHAIALLLVKEKFDSLLPILNEERHYGGMSEREATKGNDI